MAFAVAVTGGARGIGYATARAFASAGAKVVIGDVDEAAAAKAAATIGATAYRLDVRDPASFEELFVANGVPDVLVNNAGIAHAGTFLETPTELRDLQIDVNLRGVANGLAAVLGDMVARGRGHVVNVASLAGRIALPNAATYTATKFAVVGLTEAVAAEVHGSGVRVSAVLPTFVRTEMTDGLPLRGMPVVEAAEVAHTILRVVRRGGPTITTVPRWMGGVPRLAALTPQAILEALRHSSAGDVPSDSVEHTEESAAAAFEDRQARRAAYFARVRGLLPPPGE